MPTSSDTIIRGSGGNAATDFPTGCYTWTPLPHGRILVAGGVSGNSAVSSAELYDPATGTWAATARMNVGRYLHAALLLPNGKVLVTVGQSGPPSNGYSPLSAELCDPRTGRWALTGSLATARMRHHPPTWRHKR
jgi:hypothetical protein